MGQRDYQYFMSSRKNRFVVNVIYPTQINLMENFAKSSSNLFILVEHICILILAFSYIPTYHFFYFVYPTYAQPTSIFVPWILAFFTWPWWAFSPTPLLPRLSDPFFRVLQSRGIRFCGCFSCGSCVWTVPSCFEMYYDSLCMCSIHWGEG